ncbi:hypothetical protein A4S06_09390 [Erysipelotrichaceae bacterium MTC7]|nr:hypothetical protein A4S06_09390 [Erysipelotrichaceae bacterium MTC7]
MMNQLISTKHKSISFLSLLKQLQQAKLLSEEAVQAIKEVLQDITAKLVISYNQKKSSTVSTYVYKNIYRSVIYALDHVQTYKDDPRLLQADRIYEYYQQGIVILEQQMKALQHQALQIKCERLPVENERYLDVVHRQFFTFLEGYDMTYKATLCKEDFDYPLLDGLALDHHMYGLQGLDLACEYANRFYLEQCFCNRYEAQMKTLVAWYERQKGVSIHVLGLNVMELLLRQQLFACLLPHANQLLFSETEVRFLVLKIQDAATCVNIAYQRFATLVDEATYQYSLRFQARFLLELEIGIQNQSLDQLIIYKVQETQQVKFQVDHVIDNDTFLQVVEQIKGVQDCKDKIELLQNSKLSIHDVLDILDMSIFTKSEYLAYFQQLDSLTLALLVRYVYPEEFLFQQTPTLDAKCLQKLESGRDWHPILKKHLEKLDAQRKDEIQQLFQKLR